ncbi:hypothetical protein EDD86DRAFT_214041 [Gorgonomyces haynaldii]|nr:hypothetical protein EDD86DRAFT_214041 [Gorgonomyces haynaldii]
MVILFSNYPSFLSGRRSGSCLRRRVVSCLDHRLRITSQQAFSSVDIVTTGVGFYESIHVVGMLIACADKSKSLIYRLCSAAIVSQIISQMAACVALDYSISPEIAKELILKFGGLKFAALIGIRIFAAGAFIRLMTNGSIADNVTTWAIFVVAETAFYVTGSLMQKGSDKMKDSDLQTSLSQNQSRAVREIK